MFTSQFLWFPKFAQHSVDSVERGVDLFSDLVRTEKQIVSADMFKHSTGSHYRHQRARRVEIEEGRTSIQQTMRIRLTISWG